MKHHTVQRALLRGFADEQQFVVVHRRDGSSKRRSTRAASVVEGFYAYTDETGALDDRVEKALAGRLESSFPRLRDTLQSDGTVTGTDKTDLDRYVAFSLMRTRSVRSFMDQTDERLGSYVARTEIARQYGIDLAKLSPAAVAWLDHFARGVVQLGQEHRSDPVRAQIRTFVHQAARVQLLLSHLHWRHLSLPADQCAIISDACVAVLRTKSGGGLLPFATPVLLPFGPRSLAVAAMPDDVDALVEQADLVSRSNQVLADSAYEECFRHPDVPWPSDITFDGERPRLEIEFEVAKKGRRLREAADVHLRRQYSAPELDDFARDLLAELSQDLRQQ